MLTTQQRQRRFPPSRRDNNHHPNYPIMTKELLFLLVWWCCCVTPFVEAAAAAAVQPVMVESCSTLMPKKPPDTTFIDVCARALQHQNISTKAGKETPPPPLKIDAARSSNTATKIQLCMEHCTVPSGLDLIVNIPGATTSAGIGVFFSIRHVVMRNGSFVIQPTLPSNTNKNALFHNMHIEVEDVDMQTDGDLLVLNTTNFNTRHAVDNVTMSIRHSTMHSSNGNVASIITAHDAAVYNTHLFIGTNNDLYAQDQFLASIVTGSVRGCSLVVNSGNVVDATTGRCRGGPVSLRASSAEAVLKKDVGILCIGLTAKNVPRDTNRKELGVENINVLITDSSVGSCSLSGQDPSLIQPFCVEMSKQNGIFVLAESNDMAFFATVAITHEFTSMQLKQVLHVSFQLANRGVQHHFRAVGGSFGAVGSLVFPLDAFSAAITFSGASVKFYFSMLLLENDRFPLPVTIDSRGSFGAASLGILVWSRKSPDITVAATDSKLEMITDVKNSTSLLLCAMGREEHGTTATTVLGFVISITSGSSVKMQGLIKNTTVNIAPRLINTTNTTIRAACVFGIIVQSYSLSLVSRHGEVSPPATISVSIDATSTIAIIASLIGPTSSTDLLPRPKGVGVVLPSTAQSRAAFGVSVACFNDGGKNSQTAHVSVVGKISIETEFSNSIAITAAKSGGNLGTTAILGLAVLGADVVKSLLHLWHNVDISLAVQHSCVVQVFLEKAVVVGVVAHTATRQENNRVGMNISFCSDGTLNATVAQGAALLSTNVNFHVEKSNKTGTCAPERLATQRTLQSIMSTVPCCSPIRRYPSLVTPTLSLSSSRIASATRTPRFFENERTLTRSRKVTTTTTAGVTRTQTLTISENTKSNSPSSSVSQSHILPTLPPSRRVFPNPQNESAQPTAESPTTRTQRTTVTVVSSTVLVTSAANSGGPGLQDVQALVVLGSMACASDEMQTISSGGEKSVVPFELPVLEEGSRSRTLLSNTIVLVGLGIIHLLVSMIIVLKKRKPFVEACGLARFPAWSFSAFVLLYQGTILTAFRAVFSPSTSTDRILGAVLVIFCFTVPLISPLLRLRGVWTATFVTYESAFVRVPSILRIIVFPTGYYDGSPDVDPDGVVRRFGTLFTSVAEHTHPFFTTLGFVKAFLIALVAALPPDAIGCPTRFSLVGVLSFIMAVLVILRRPWRVSLNNILSGLSNLCTAALCFASTKPEVVGSQVSSIITATVGLGMITSVSGIIMKLLEVVKWKKEEQRQRATDELSVPMMDRPSSTKSTRHKKQLLDVQDVDDEVEEAEKEQPLHILSQHAANPLLAAGEDDDDDVGSNESPSEVTSNDSSEDYSSEDDEEEDEQEEEVG